MILVRLEMDNVREPESNPQMPVPVDSDPASLLLLKLKLVGIAEEKFGFIPYGWQIQLALSLLQGKSVICIAATGKGKTLPFCLPGLITKKFTIVLSPLNALEEDQVRTNCINWRVPIIMLAHVGHPLRKTWSSRCCIEWEQLQPQCI